MSDLVSRQAAMDAAIEAVDDWDGSTSIGRQKRIEKAIKALPPVQSEPQWIPCKTLLPELDDDGYSEQVLVCFSNFIGCEICEYRKNEEQDGWYIGDSDENPEDIDVHVIAWMPLPDPYRPEGGQK